MNTSINEWKCTVKTPPNSINEYETCFNGPPSRGILMTIKRTWDGERWRCAVSGEPLSSWTSSLIYYRNI